MHDLRIALPFVLIDLLAMSFYLLPVVIAVSLSFLPFIAFPLYGPFHEAPPAPLPVSYLLPSILSCHCLPLVKNFFLLFESAVHPVLYPPSY